MNNDLIKYLAKYVSEHKKCKMEQVLSNRTRHITVVLENLHKPHNGSAVLRTAECFGIQDIFIVEESNKYKANPYVTRGSSKWIDVLKYSGEGIKGVDACYQQLKEKGYYLVATTPDKDAVNLESIQVDQKIALIFGNEYEGLSKYALENADKKISLPMYGFTESYNISVTAAICLFNLMGKLRGSKINWKLTEEEKEELRLKWYKRVIKQSGILEKEFYKGLK